MKRHIILTLGRSGSNALMDMLNQHPEVLNIGEVMGDWSVFRKLRRFFGSEAAYLDFLLNNRWFLRGANVLRSLGKYRKGRSREAKRFGRIRTVGLKDFTFHFHAHGAEHYLRDRPDIQVIGLIRDDIFAKTLSRANLRLRDVVAASTDPNQTPEIRNDPKATPEERAAQARAGDSGKIVLDPELFLEWLQNAQDEDDQLRAMLDQLPPERVRILTYEELFSSEEHRREIVADLFRFIGVEPVETATRSVKLNKTPPEELIYNFEECRAAARGTRFAHYFEPATG
jgi:hypothetical protein